MGNKRPDISKDLPEDVKTIVAVHLLNDYSGSPLIFSQILNGLLEDGFQIDLHTSNGVKGFLTGHDFNYFYFGYRFFSNLSFRLIAFLWAQYKMFSNLLKYKNEKIVIYVNTLLPFGAALAGWYMNKPVIYHIHEHTVKPAILKKFLKTIAKKTADKVVYVSKFLKEKEALAGVPGRVIYNGLSDQFCKEADQTMRKIHKPDIFTCVMLCSLKGYKGVRELVRLAELLPSIQFQLVLNASEQEIESFFKPDNIPANCHIYPVQTNVHPFYACSHLVLNLSHPEYWVETFGMTLLEGMYYGLPCIGPPVGGPTEIIVNGKNGYLIDQRKLDLLVWQIEILSKNKKLYSMLSENAKLQSQNFKGSDMYDGVRRELRRFWPVKMKKMLY